MNCQAASPTNRVNRGYRHLIQMTLFRSILHPTDFSELSAAAFAHALCIALAGRAKLQLLHVLQHKSGSALAFPHARRLLAQWDMIDEDEAPSSVADKLGI